VIGLHIKEKWGQIDPATKKWLIDNPGCVVLPRTISTVISKETGQVPDNSLHGETVLSDEDWAFIRSEASLADDPRARDFHDAVHPHRTPR
jgi:hypothetical protein